MLNYFKWWIRLVFEFSQFIISVIALIICVIILIPCAPYWFKKDSISNKIFSKIYGWYSDIIDKVLLRNIK